MHDHAGRILKLQAGLLQQPVVGFEEALIDEIVALDASEGIDEIILVEARRGGDRALDRQGLAFPAGPGTGGLYTGGFVRTRQTLVEGIDEITALGLRDRGDIAVESIREEAAGAFLVEPLDLGFRDEENAAQHEAEHTRRMGDGIGQRQRRAPGAAEHQPAGHAHMLAQGFHVLDQVPGRVALKFRMRS